LITNDAAPRAATDKVRVAVADRCGEPPSITVTPREKFPLTEGVPKIIPLDAVRDIPDGSWPEVMLQV
jgi:hypothetical protein